MLRLLETGHDQKVNVSHQELADTTAAYRETVTVALDEFQARGVVSLGRRTIQILDRSALEDLATR